MKTQKVLEVRVISANPDDEYYWINYLVEIKEGVLRRSKTLFHNGKLKRDGKNKYLLAAVKKTVEDYKLYNTEF